MLAWSEPVSIPTYAVGEPQPLPLFLEKRVYQGSSGAVYPYPVIESVSSEKRDRTWTAVFLENRWLKVMILPELGGRLHMAVDKTNGYAFVYHCRVIKPALAGLCGPWISGGIEFNWPQHHRPSTFSPVDWKIEREPDGTAVVWCSEIERMSGMKGMHGFALSPDDAVLEVRVQLCNPTALPQTFLWWANPAVHANEHTQSIFPPDVHAVMDHGKRAVSSFPIATGEYYKVDYSPGTDISFYRNIPVPTSYMAYHSDYDFLGHYDHARRAGMLHGANHHTVPGKKQWTWGHGDFGRAWDRQLTDEDGPYIELMCGAYTDNQPDFSWLMPGEEKQFVQCFFPYKEIGVVKNATREAAVSLELADGRATMGVYVTGPGTFRIELASRDAVLFACEEELSPERAWVHGVDVPERARPTLRVLRDGAVLVEYTPHDEAERDLPPPATPAPPPAKVASCEELWLHGLHLEQYRHATYRPEPYYEEALRRDPGDMRCNNAMGLLFYRRGKFGEAEEYFRRAIARATLRNPNPYDGEAHYNLGLALRMQGRDQEALDAFWKATWNEAWAAAASYELACLYAEYDDNARARELATQCLKGNTEFHRARNLRAALLRRMGREREARAETDMALRRDAWNLGALYERELLAGEADWPEGARDTAETRIGLALDYAHAGLWDEAIPLLRDSPRKTALLWYFLAWIHRLAGDEAAALQALQEAPALGYDFCFPHRLECVPALLCARERCPDDALAAYALGNFWYSRRQYPDAIAEWEDAVRLDSDCAYAHRNLGLAYFNHCGDADRAVGAFERAFALRPDDARLCFELDQLCRRLNRSIAERLGFLANRPSLVEERDDLTLEYVKLLNLSGRHEEALGVLARREFHPWEGGEGKATGAYVFALVELARADLMAGRPEQALEKLARARTYPDNLGEGKLPNTPENHLDYWSGRACEMLNRTDDAREWFTRAATGRIDLQSATYYNDAPPDRAFYQGFAHAALGDAGAAAGIFRQMIAYGQAHMDDDVGIDYFAVSLPDFLIFEDDLSRRNRAHCHYMIALGELGRNHLFEARAAFDRVLELQADHPGAILHRGMT